MKLLISLLIGVCIATITFVLGINYARSYGFGGIFLIPVIFVWMLIAVVGGALTGILLQTERISTKGANPRTILKILLFGFLIFGLIIIKTFWIEFFR